MNLLTDAPPSEVNVGGVVYPVNSDFRSCLRIILAFEDDNLAAYEKQAILLQNLFGGPTHNPAAAVEAGLRFLDSGREPGDDEGGPRLFSFAGDAAIILSAFRQTHGIDLTTAELHWWTFLALFMDLGQDTTFCQLAALRKRVKTGRATREELQVAAEMGDAFEPQVDDSTPEERAREAEFMRALEEGARGGK